MTNNSSTGGYLQPTSSPIAEDDALDNIIQSVVVGITALPGSMVRPRWQPNPPKEPEINADWCAIGIISEIPESNQAIIRHHPDGNGYDEQQQHVMLDIMASFYGPNARGNASLLRDGLMIPQNREAMFHQGIALVGQPGTLTMAPDLVNTTWRKRVDIIFRFRRVITRTWPIENLLEASGVIKEEQGHNTPWDTDNARLDP